MLFTIKHPLVIAKLIRNVLQMCVCEACFIDKKKRLHPCFRHYVRNDWFTNKCVNMANANRTRT